MHTLNTPSPIQASSAAIKEIISEVKDFSIEEHKKLVTVADEATITRVTALITVDVLFACLRKALAQKDEYLLLKWSAAFRTLRASIKSKLELLTTLSPTKAAHLEMMSTIYLFMLNCQISPADMLTYLGDVSVRENLAAMGVALHPDATALAPMDAPDVTTLLQLAFVLINVHRVHLEQIKNQESLKNLHQATAYFVQDLLGAYFLDPITSSLASVDIPSACYRSVEFLLSLSLPTNDENVEAIRKDLLRHLPLPWRLTLLSQWLSKVPHKWRHGILNAAARMIRDSMKTSAHKYRFDPSLLLGIDETGKPLLYTNYY